MSPAPTIAVSGTLLSPRAAADWLRAHEAEPAASAAVRIAQWASDAAARLGPSAGTGRLLAALEELFERALGYECRREPACSFAIAAQDRSIALTASGWGRPLALESRDVLRAAALGGADWAAGFNGISLGLIDARAGAPRRVASFALADLASHAGAARLAAALLHADSLARGLLAHAIAASDRSCAETREALRDGVQTSLRALARELPFDAALLVLFRMLFVLFAEARALVPVWHRIYRDHYSLASLAPGGTIRDARGTWAALEGARRLLGEGCRAGSLQIAGFNGRLFSAKPARKWARSAYLDSALDRPAADALASLVAFRPSRGGARQVDYAELDVEELGSIYERVLDLDPIAEGRARKESGSYYTPAPLTHFIVRRALAPLVNGRSSDEILALRVLDPAMGSGAFLVAALRVLSKALERALVDEGQLPEHDVTEADRRELRRRVAQRCLYGVDVNPMAVMLAKLSLWLATLAAGKPLGFLDHRLRCGNSLIGGDTSVTRHPPGRVLLREWLPLFESTDPSIVLRESVARVTSLAAMPEDTVDDVRRKQKIFESLATGSGTVRWRALFDVWCAWWFAPAVRRPDAREYGAVADFLIRGASALPRPALDRRLREAGRIAAREHFFHWPLEFPEVFADRAPGFDAVLGNPPWEMLRAGSGSGTRGSIKSFARGSNIYRLAGSGHINLYQLFIERALSLARSGGRIGMVVPWGLMTDEGSAGLRRALLEGTRVETLVRLDNHDGAFQAHRSLRFAAVTAETGQSTETFELSRVGGHAELDDLPDMHPPGRGVTVTRRALAAIDRSALRVPDVACGRDLAMLLKLTARHRSLGDPEGWGASFGRELNLTEDRHAFSRSGMPVIEGKHLHPFRVEMEEARHRITAAAAARLLPDRPFDRPRLAYRDVTAATNRQTLIAAIVPRGVVTGHSLFCLRNPWDLATQRALCAILNSSVANFLVRLFVSSHVTTSLIAWLPVPDREHAVPALGRAAAGDADEVVAGLYGLAPGEREAI